MNFSYWAWANAHRSKKYREQAMVYLNSAIKIDPEYTAGRKKAEDLKREFTK